MASWAIHLKLAHALSQQLNIDKDLFAFGNILVDVDKDCKYTRLNSHYYNGIVYETFPDIKKIDFCAFFNDYRMKLKNPLILGYYTHLLTDQFYNEYFYNNKCVIDDNHKIVGIKNASGKIIKINNYDQAVKLKHDDLNLYGKYLYDEKLDISFDKEKILQNIFILKDNFYSAGNAINRMNYLQKDYPKFNKLSFKEKLKKHQYKLFTKEELDALYNDCLIYVLKCIQEESII